MNLQPKSRLTSFILTFFFAVFGLFYVAPVAATVLLLVTLLTGGLALPFTWIVSMIWGDHKVRQHNANIAIMRDLAGGGR